MHASACAALKLSLTMCGTHGMATQRLEIRHVRPRVKTACHCTPVKPFSSPSPSPLPMPAPAKPPCLPTSAQDSRSRLKRALPALPMGTGMPPAPATAQQLTGSPALAQAPWMPRTRRMAAASSSACGGGRERAATRPPRGPASAASRASSPPGRSRSLADDRKVAIHAFDHT